jgi:predicted phage terminase large subunit-like protein
MTIMALPPGVDPDQLRFRVDRELAERSLAAFTRQGWASIDPAPFIDNWHLEVMSERLEAVTRGEIQKLIINIPPRHEKSIKTAVAWPAWTWAQSKRNFLAGPQVQFLFASYAQTLSIRDSVKCRRLIESAWYQTRWGDRFALTGDQNTKIRFDNDQGGYRLATSVGGALTGEGGSIIVVDDPHNVTDIVSDIQRLSDLLWWDEAMSTRRNDPKTGAYVIIMQRLHDRDLTGHILATERDWEHLCLPMRYEKSHPHVSVLDRRTEEGELLWPARIDEAAAQELERKGEYMVAGQLQQRPVPRGGAMFKREWFEVVDALPSVVASRARGWDLAATEEQQGSQPAYTATVKMSKTKDGFYYIEHAERARRSPAGVEAMITGYAKADGKKIPIALPQDPAQAGKSQAHYYKTRLSGWVVRCQPPTGSKPARAAPVASQAEVGNIKVLRGPWNEEFFGELCLFPNGTFKDFTDALSEVFDYLEHGISLVEVKAIDIPRVSPYAM